MYDIIYDIMHTFRLYMMYDIIHNIMMSEAADPPQAQSVDARDDGLWTENT